jgi:hypothetical protein
LKVITALLTCGSDKINFNGHLAGFAGANNIHEKRCPCFEPKIVREFHFALRAIELSILKSSPGNSNFPSDITLDNRPLTAVHDTSLWFAMDLKFFHITL